MSTESNRADTGMCTVLKSREPLSRIVPLERTSAAECRMPA
jgi:hypothetical protein